MSYRFADSLRAGSERNRFRSDPARKLYDIYHCCVYSKDVEFYSKNKFEILVHLVGFVIRIYHAARSPERRTHPILPCPKHATCFILNEASPLCFI